MDLDELRKHVKASGKVWVSQDPCPKPPDVPEESPRETKQNARRRFAAMLQEEGSEALEQERERLEQAAKEQRQHMYERRRALERLEESLQEPRPGFVEDMQRDRDRIRRRMKQNQKVYDALRLQREEAERVLVEYRATGQIPETEEKERKPEPPYHPQTSEYLELAYRWLEAGKRPEGKRPTELWQYLRDETGGTLRSIRAVFEKHGWYKTDGEVLRPDGPTQAEYTVNAVLEEGEKYF